MYGMSGLNRHFFFIYFCESLFRKTCIFTTHKNFFKTKCVHEYILSFLLFSTTVVLLKCSCCLRCLVAVLGTIPLSLSLSLTDCTRVCSLQEHSVAAKASNAVEASGCVWRCKAYEHLSNSVCPLALPWLVYIIHRGDTCYAK
jgi:hypothetical protein